MVCWYMVNKQLSDTFHVANGQAMLMVTLSVHFAPMFNLVGFVLLFCSPGQIVQPTVKPDAVQVPCFLSCRSRSAEGSQDKVVNSPLCLATVWIDQADDTVAGLFLDDVLQVSPEMGGDLNSYPAIAADFVTWETDNWSILYKRGHDAHMLGVVFWDRAGYVCPVPSIL